MLKKFSSTSFDFEESIIGVSARYMMAYPRESCSNAQNVSDVMRRF